MENYLISKIIVGPRIRPLDNDFIQELTQSIQREGLLEPILITREGKLIVGAHRLEVFKRLGRTEIPVIILDVSESMAAIMEIDENLIRKELSVLQKAEMLARKKEIYEKEHPETRPGGDRNSNRQGGDMKVPRFTKQITGATSMSERTAQRLTQIFKMDAGVRTQLHGTWIADNQMVLLAISGLPLLGQQEFVKNIKAGAKKTIAEKQKALNLIGQLKKDSKNTPEGLAKPMGHPLEDHRRNRDQEPAFKPIAIVSNGFKNNKMDLENIDGDIDYITDEPDRFQEDDQDDSDPDRIPSQIEAAGDKYPTPPSRHRRPVTAPKRPVGSPKSAAAKEEPSNDVLEAKADVGPKLEPSQQIIRIFNELSGWNYAILVKSSILAAITEMMDEQTDLEAQIQITTPKGENLKLPIKLSLSDSLKGGWIMLGTGIPQENKELIVDIGSMRKVS